MHHRILPCSLLALTALAFAAPAKTPAAVAVKVGGDEVLDACGSLGQVTGLKAGGDGFLAVRSGPGTAYAVLDKLGNGREVYLCGGDEQWIAIVYPTAPRMHCGVTSPIAVSREYRGPCKSGWVRATWIEVMAG